MTGLPASHLRYRGSVPGKDKKWSPNVQEDSGIQDCFFLKGSRPSVGSTQPSVRYLPEVKRLGHEVDLSPHLVSELTSRVYLHYLICLQGVHRDICTHYYTNVYSILYLSNSHTSISHKYGSFNSFSNSENAELTPPLQILITSYCENNRHPVNAIRRQNAEFLNIEMCNFRFSPCISIANHFYYPTNALNCTKLRD